MDGFSPAQASTGCVLSCVEFGPVQRCTSLIAAGAKRRLFLKKCTLNVSWNKDRSRWFPAGGARFGVHAVLRTNVAGSVGLTIVANRLLMRGFQGTGASRREELGRGADVRGCDGSPVFQRRDSNLVVSRVPSDGEGDSDQVCHRINPPNVYVDMVHVAKGYFIVLKVYSQQLCKSRCEGAGTELYENENVYVHKIEPPHLEICIRVRDAYLGSGMRI